MGQGAGHRSARAAIAHLLCSSMLQWAAPPLRCMPACRVASVSGSAGGLRLPTDLARRRAVPPCPAPQYYYAVRAGADWMEAYKPANQSDFSGLLRLVESNGINANNLQVSHMGAGKHCAFPGAAPPTPDEQRLEAAKRNLARVCVVVLPVRQSSFSALPAAAAAAGG